MSSPAQHQKKIGDAQVEEDVEWVSVPPDGGWGWLVLGGTVLINMLIPGMIKSFGVLFVEFLEVFETTPVIASFIPALCYFLYGSLGPLTTYLSVKTSYMTVTMAGGLFAAFGMILSCFATSIIYLYFSFGVMVGLGAGLSFPPGIYLTTSYFVKYRGIANGLAISGSAIGSIILPPFLRVLLEFYGYRGAILIMGGLCLHVIVGALLYHPVEMHMKKVKVAKEVGNGVEDKEMVTLSVQESSPTSPKPEVDFEQPLIDRKDHRKVSSSSARVLGSSSQISRKISAYASPMSLGSAGQISRNYSVASNMSISSFKYVSTAFHGSTLVGLHHEFSSNATVKDTSTKSFLCCCSKPDVPSKPSPKPSPLRELMKNPIFLIILISNATNAIGYVNFTILVPSYAIDLGFDKGRASYLLSIIASTDLVGRIGGAALSDFLKIDKKVYFIGGYLLSGIALVTLPLFSTYLWIGIFCALFGLASGTYVGITAVIMVELLGEELLASSYGISLFINGVLQLIGPPVCNAIFEQIGSYAAIVTGLGAVLISGAAVWLVVPFLPPKSS